mmetsp:Transcript_35602/g.42876  ORF Transcript_35602/g.42876 Transcript_35602/m.42876 type:complete len:119 (-) Transcript_35602:1126-1482(-)|eukprot:CAMPEP_0197846226 /NCGR_PEP_ID=MMETSP1438-20131217/3006_1 /TAXON_ID=1461541 /ORGANISM="Pterosperma sp., Strain CCMP1384" /LENGTH=118 /DNA_ID=CAMNT_0043457797 /DNA_START=156 /DNA_END=512 /DNA_ORIENTATION=-
MTDKPTGQLSSRGFTLNITTPRVGAAVPTPRTPGRTEAGEEQPLTQEEKSSIGVQEVLEELRKRKAAGSFMDDLAILGEELLRTLDTATGEDLAHVLKEIGQGKFADVVPGASKKYAT